VNEPSFIGAPLAAGTPRERRSATGASARYPTERQARPHPRRGDQGLRRAGIPQRHRGGDRPRRRGGRRHHLPVFQGKRRPAPSPLRREDDRAARRGEGRPGTGTDRSWQAPALHPAASHDGGAQPGTGRGADRGDAAERPVPQGGRPAEAGRLRRSHRRSRPFRAGDGGAGREHLACDGEAGAVRRARRAGPGVALGRQAGGPEEDRERSVGMAGAGASARTGRQVLKILVTIKRVEDYESKIKVKPDNSWIVTEGVNYRANPFDEIAVEEALRLRDANMPSEVVAVSIGSAAAQAEIRSALAMGADRGILVKHDGFVDSDAVARLLQKVIEKEKPDLVLMGKQAVDVDDNVTGQLLAEYLGWGQATFASKKESLESPEEKAKKPGLKLGADKKSLQVAREVDGGLEVLEVQLPAIVTVDLRLNVPRYASLPNIMKAKKKPIEELAPAALGVDVAPKVKVVRVEAPPARAAGIKVPDVATLVKKLHEDAKVV